MSNTGTLPVGIDMAHAALSTAREKILEHRLVSDLAVLLLRRGTELDVLRSEFDAQGHDVVLEAAGIIRHIQLKATIAGGARRDVGINVRLRSKPSGCVVWMTYDPETLAITQYRWFGAAPGEPLPDLGSRLVRHTKGDARGLKATRPGHRLLGKGQFELLSGLDALADRLFGRPVSAATSLVLTQLREEHGRSWFSEVARAVEEPSFAGTAQLAHLVDGYRVLEQLHALDAPAWLQQREEASCVDSLEPDFGLLWTELFMEHRRWRTASPYQPDAQQLVRLDRLASRLVASLEAVKPA